MGEGEVTRQKDPETFYRVLGEAVAALEDAGIPYALFGSLATERYGRPCTVGDVDAFLRPEDGRPALERLGRAGFDTDEQDPQWILKASRDGVLVDLIFRVRGGIYLDDEMIEHRRVHELGGVEAAMVSPEDAVLIEAASADDEIPEHWFNAVRIIAATELDWDYLLRRARHSPARVLGALLYARSDDLVVPEHAVRTLFETLYPQ